MPSLSQLQGGGGGGGGAALEEAMLILMPIYHMTVSVYFSPYYNNRTPTPPPLPHSPAYDLWPFVPELEWKADDDSEDFHRPQRRESCLKN